MSLDRYAVIGNPVAHSLSPRIHQLFAIQTGQSLIYEKLEAPDGFLPAVTAFREQGGKGLSVTLPFKQQAFTYVTTATDRAQRCQAVNVIHFVGDEVIGDNSDGLGLCRDLENNLGFVIANKRILVVGCGGATRGILPSLMAANPSMLVLTNRTLATAHSLAIEFSTEGSILVLSSDELAAQHFDLIINATSAGLKGAIPVLPTELIQPTTFFYDLSYAAKATPFLTWARAHGAVNCADGLGMLVEQAACAFERWRGVRPETRSVIAALTNELGRV